MKNALTVKGLDILNARNAMKHIEDIETKKHMLVLLPSVVKTLLIEDFEKNYPENEFIEKLVTLTNQKTYGDKKELEKIKLDKFLASKGLERYSLDRNQYNELLITRIIRFKYEDLKKLFAMSDQQIQDDVNGHIKWFIERRAEALLEEAKSYILVNTKLSKKKNISQSINYTIDNRNIVFHYKVNSSLSQNEIANNANMFLFAMNSIEGGING